MSGFWTECILAGALRIGHTAVAGLAFRCLAYLIISVCDQCIVVACAKLLLIGTLWIVYTAVAGLTVCRLAVNFPELNPP